MRIHTNAPYQLRRISFVQPYSAQPEVCPFSSVSNALRQPAGEGPALARALQTRGRRAQFFFGK